MTTAGKTDSIQAPKHAMKGFVYQQVGDKLASTSVIGQRLDDWCAMAEATGLAPMKRFVGRLRRHRTGI